MKDAVNPIPNVKRLLSIVSHELIETKEFPGMVPDQSVEFALVAESGVLERQAIILCESIRKFAGKYADSPITVISPRSDREAFGRNNDTPFLAWCGIPSARYCEH